MQKKFWCLLTALSLIVLCVRPIRGLADTVPQTTAISAYHTVDTLYSFLRLSETAGDGKANLLLRDMEQGEAQPLTTRVCDSNSTVSYMLLLDLSTSMKSYVEIVRGFADALVQAERQEIKVTVAAFGDHFEIFEKDLLGITSVRDALKKLKYDHQETDICGGLSEAMDYLSRQTRQEGEIVNLILLTDGVPYYAEESKRETIEQTAEEVQELITGTPEIIVHTVGLKEWDVLVHDAVSSGSGMDLMACTREEATAAGTEIAEFIDGLYRIDFPYAWQSLDMRTEARLRLSWTDADMEILSLGSVCSIDKLAADASETQGEMPEKGGGETDVPAGSMEDTAAADAVAQDLETTDAPAEEMAATDDPTTDDGGNSDSGSGVLLIAGIGAAAILGVGLAVLALRVRGEKKKNASASGVGIEMKLDMIEGKCKKQEKAFLFRDELFIGSSASCDLVFSEKNIEEKHARVFWDNGIIYLENLSGTTNVSIGGMKIYRPNRLRSGDEITIGSVRFRLLF